jgi:uncharacterized protein YndB with AHSA1/START domain
MAEWRINMPDIVHEFHIKAAPGRVFDAIATQEGLSSWWTRDTEAQSKIGSVAVFGFGKRSLIFRMAIQTLDRGRLIAWHCIGDHEEWKDTRLTFDLQPGATGNDTVMRFKHAGWRSAEGWLGSCSYTWAHVLGRLKSYAETGERSPYFTA